MSDDQRIAKKIEQELAFIAARRADLTWKYADAQRTIQLLATLRKEEKQAQRIIREFGAKFEELRLQERSVYMKAREEVKQENQRAELQQNQFGIAPRGSQFNVNAQTPLPRQQGNVNARQQRHTHH